MGPHAAGVVRGAGRVRAGWLAVFRARVLRLARSPLSWHAHALLVPFSRWHTPRLPLQVRNPLDRAISSYIRTMRYPSLSEPFEQLGRACGPSVNASACKATASFRQFARALDLRAEEGGNSAGDMHFMAQTVPHAAGLVAVPTEMFNHPEIRDHGMPQRQPRRFAHGRAGG